MVLVTEEGLGGDIEPLRRAIENQPEIGRSCPVLLLVSKNAHRPGAADAARIAASRLASNIIVLERPLGSIRR
ncbi:hypothetical protein ACRAWD_30405 [Caulobacter segnis]